MNKYPFSEDANSPAASVQDVNQVFRGKDSPVWRFYEEVGKKYLDQRGAEYAPKPDLKPGMRPAYATFFSRVAAISRAFYPTGNEASPSISFTLSILHSADIRDAKVNIDQQTVPYSAPNPTRINWTATSTSQIALPVTFVDGSAPNFQPSSGTWAVFDFFSYQENWMRLGASKAQFDRYISEKNRKLKLNNGNLVRVTFEVDTSPAPMIFAPGYLKSLTCPAGPALQ